MIDLTFSQISAAKANDLSATTAVLEAMEERVLQIATKAARIGATVQREQAEDFAQTGRIAVWEGLAKFTGNSVAEFFTYMDTTITGMVELARMREHRQGVSADASQQFVKALAACGGDPFEAERFLQTPEFGKGRMSLDLAHAARLAWQGRESLDLPRRPSFGESAGITIGENLADTTPLPGDEPTDRERETARQRETREGVRETLGKMGTQARAILCGTYGIAMGDTPYFGTENEAEFAAHLGIAVKNMQSCRPNAKRRFRVLYLAGAFGVLADEPEAPAAA